MPEDKLIRPFTPATHHTVCWGGQQGKRLPTSTSCKLGQQVSIWQIKMGWPNIHWVGRWQPCSCLDLKLRLPLEPELAPCGWRCPDWRRPHCDEVNLVDTALDGRICAGQLNTFSYRVHFGLQSRLQLPLGILVHNRSPAKQYGNNNTKGQWLSLKLTSFKEDTVCMHVLALSVAGWSCLLL
jgi:hypothetical protein